MCLGNRELEKKENFNHAGQRNAITVVIEAIEKKWFNTLDIKESDERILKSLISSRAVDDFPYLFLHVKNL